MWDNKCFMKGRMHWVSRRRRVSREICCSTCQSCALEENWLVEIILEGVKRPKIRQFVTRFFGDPTLACAIVPNMSVTSGIQSGAVHSTKRSSDMIEEEIPRGPSSWKRVKF